MGGNPADWFDAPQWSCCHFSHYIYAEMAAFAEIFPEAVERKFKSSEAEDTHGYGDEYDNPDSDYNYLRKRTNFSIRLEELGFTMWDVGGKEKSDYYRALYETPHEDLRPRPDRI